VRWTRAIKTAVRELQRSRRPNINELAHEAGVSPSTMAQQISKLRSRKVFIAEVCICDPKQLNLFQLLFIKVKCDNPDLLKVWAASNDLVMECHSLLSDDGYLLKVRLPSFDDYQSFKEQMAHDAGIIGADPILMGQTIKETHEMSCDYVELGASIVTPLHY
jgi:DNA-binding Lrp family transcriptional regulator